MSETVGAGGSLGGAAAATSMTSVLKGTGWNVARYFLPQINTLVLSVAAARFLGPDGMGRQSLIAFAQVSVVMLMTAGIPLSLMRFTAETIGRGRHAQVRALVRWAWRLELVAALLGGSALLAVATQRADLRAAWVLAAVTGAVGIMHTVPTAVLIGLQRWRTVSIISLLTGTAATVAGPSTPGPDGSSSF